MYIYISYQNININYIFLCFRKLIVGSSFNFFMRRIKLHTSKHPQIRMIVVALSTSDLFIISRRKKSPESDK